ncbi:MAG: SgcJ/EcaC family oxidoreductase [Parvularculaceae bacterium]
MRSPVEVVQAQLDAYNAQNLDGFCACFADDCVMGEFNGAVATSGKPAIRARYQALFAEFPKNRAQLINRIAVGDVVIDHEDIERAPGNRFLMAMIYTVKNGLIARADAVREH